MAGRPQLFMVKGSDPGLRAAMKVHYSQPKGFVGRDICFAVSFQGKIYGYTVAGSCTRHLPRRQEFFPDVPLNNIVNNVFFHIEGPYPFRNFAQSVVAEYRDAVMELWPFYYGDSVMGLETLVEPPRSGEVYIRDGWIEAGMTKGETCKRSSGKGTDRWGGARVWDRVNLKPKKVFYRRVD